MDKKIMQILAEETGGKSYKAHKYGLDHSERPFIDYGEDEIVWKKTAETEHIRNYVDLTHRSRQVAEHGDQLLTYFLDGSRRVFKVDDIAYPEPGGRSVIYPVIAGQIGVGCCKRENKIVRPEKFKSEIVLVVPNKADADGKPGFLQATAKKLNESPELKKLNLAFSTLLQYKTGKGKFDDKYEDRGTACVQDRMIMREKEMVQELVRERKLNQNNYLVKDGPLEYRPTKEDRVDKKKYQLFKNNYNWVLGVSKNFNPEVCLDINGKPNPGYIADLPLYHRTPVACFSNPEFFGDMQFAIWYIRIHAKERTRTAFDGIIKVEKMLVTEEENENGIDSDLVDTLSAYLVNERNPVCYGTDLRWANHIYPIYLTETYVKSKYLNTESFLHLF